MDEAESPERRDDAGERRAQRAAPVVEVHPAEDPLHAVRHGEDPEDVARVVVDPAVEPRLAGHEDLELALRHLDLHGLRVVRSLVPEGDLLARLVLRHLAGQRRAVLGGDPVDRLDDVTGLELGVACGRATIDDLDDGRRDAVGLEWILALEERADPAGVERRDHALVDLGKGASVVQTAFDEVRAYERGLVVERDQDAVDALRVVDDASDVGGVVRRLRQTDHDGLGSEETARLRAQIARGAVADRVDLVVVHAVHLIDGLGDLVDAGEGLDVEDVSFLHLDHQLDVVRAAEGPRVFVVDLDERMALRKQVAEAGLELQLEAPVGEEAGDDQHQHHDRVAIVDQPFAEPVEGFFVLLADVFHAHGRNPLGLVFSLATAASSCRRRWCGRSDRSRPPSSRAADPKNRFPAAM